MATKGHKLIGGERAGKILGCCAYTVHKLYLNTGILRNYGVTRPGARRRVILYRLMDIRRLAEILKAGLDPARALPAERPTPIRRSVQAQPSKPALPAGFVALAMARAELDVEYARRLDALAKQVGRSVAMVA